MTNVCSKHDLKSFRLSYAETEVPIARIFKNEKLVIETPTTKTFTICGVYCKYIPFTQPYKYIREVPKIKSGYERRSISRSGESEELSNKLLHHQ